MDQVVKCIQKTAPSYLLKDILLREKISSAYGAINIIQDSITQKRKYYVGLGSGTSSLIFVHLFSALYKKSKEQLVFVCSSQETCYHAKLCDFKVVSLDFCPFLDFYVDGTDEISHDFYMIKGKGGALFREKILYEVAKKSIILASLNKYHPFIGKVGLIPVEIDPFSIYFTCLSVSSILKNFIEKTSHFCIRINMDGRPFLTDGNRYIADFFFSSVAIRNIKELSLHINSVPGVINHGIFLPHCNQILCIGYHNRYEIIGPR